VIVIVVEERRKTAADECARPPRSDVGIDCHIDWFGIDGQSRHGVLPGLRCSEIPRYFEILTRVTAFTRLLARTKSPSRVTEVLRTMLPPPGIAQL
jgi:hypothetical protein